MICAMLILIFNAGIAVGAWQIYRQLHEYSEGADFYTDLEEYVKVPEAFIYWGVEQLRMHLFRCNKRYGFIRPE